eukprot:6201648-Pleurochrysis_carterae.AAC.5
MWPPYLGVRLLAPARGRGSRAGRCTGIGPLAAARRLVGRCPPGFGAKAGRAQEHADLVEKQVFLVERQVASQEKSSKFGQETASFGYERGGVWRRSCASDHARTCGRSPMIEVNKLAAPVRFCLPPRRANRLPTTSARRSGTKTDGTRASDT